MRCAFADWITSSVTGSHCQATASAAFRANSRQSWARQSSLCRRLFLRLLLGAHPAEEGGGDARAVVLTRASPRELARPPTLSSWLVQPSSKHRGVPCWEARLLRTDPIIPTSRARPTDRPMRENYTSLPRASNLQLPCSSLAGSIPNEDAHEAAGRKAPRGPVAALAPRLTRGGRAPRPRRAACPAPRPRPTGCGWPWSGAEATVGSLPGARRRGGAPPWGSGSRSHRRRWRYRRSSSCPRLNRLCQSRWCCPWSHPPEPPAPLELVSPPEPPVPVPMVLPVVSPPEPPAPPELLLPPEPPVAVTQAPLWQTPPVQAVPSGFAGVSHAPDDGSHVPATWHWSLGYRSPGSPPYTHRPGRCRSGYRRCHHHTHCRWASP